VSLSVSLPNNTFKLPPVTKSATGTTAKVAFTFPGQGRATLTLKEAVKRSKHGKPRTLSTPVVIRSTGAGRQAVSVKLNAAGRRLLAHEGKLKLTLVITFQPTGGEVSTQSMTVILHAPRHHTALRQPGRD